MTVFFLRLQELSALKKKEVSGNKLAGQTPENWEAIARIKSAALKRTIAEFIEKQLS